MFKFDCPHCQQNISAEEDYSGMNVQCPTCGADFVVPSPYAEKEIGATPPLGTTSEIPSYPGNSPEAPKPETNPELGSPHAFAERLRDGNNIAQKGAKAMKQGAMVGWTGLKRRSKQAALKPQIEKLRNIDLRKALHTLGKEAFEQGILATELVEQFQAIQELDSRISEMREKAAADSEETKLAALKRVSKDTAKASQAQALTLKREYLITELGREIHARKAQMVTQELSDASAAIADIEYRIQDMEGEMLALNDGGKSNIQTLAVAAAIGLFAIVGATYGLNLLSNVNEQETSTESDANTEAEELENRRQELMARASQLRNPDGSWKGSGDSAWNKAAEREEAQRRFVEDFQERNAEKVERENRRKYYDKYSQ